MAAQDDKPPFEKKNGPKLQDGKKDNREELMVPPHADGAEKSILSSMIQDPEEYIGRAVEGTLTPGHFYLPSHGKLFEVLVEYFESGKTVELLALSQHLIDRDLLDTIGGPSALGEIYTAFENPEDVQEFLDSVEQKVLEIREASETNEEMDVKSAVAEVMVFLQEFLAGDRGISGMTTGYSELDKMINGLKAPDMFVIAARPSMGKTSFMMNIVEHVAISSAKPAMVFSCEMSTVQIVQRLVFSRARFEFQKLTKGYQPNKGDLERIKQASAEVSASKLFIDDTAGISINDLRAKARRKHRDEGISVIAIDYLQLMKSTSKQASNSREREIAEISGFSTVKFTTKTAKKNETKTTAKPSSSSQKTVTAPLVVSPSPSSRTSCASKLEPSPQSLISVQLSTNGLANHLA